MGFLDSVKGNVSDVFNKGAAAAGRAADSANLKLRQSDAEQRRRDALTRLGESLYEEVRATPALRVGREEIMAELSVIDDELAGIAEELERIASEKAAAKAARYCANCGAPLVKGANFCTNCGAATPVTAKAELIEAADVERAGEAPTYDFVVEGTVVEVDSIPDYPAPDYPGPDGDPLATDPAVVPEYAVEEGYPEADVPPATDATVDYPAMEYPGPGVTPAAGIEDAVEAAEEEAAAATEVDYATEGYPHRGVTPAAGVADVE